MSKKIIISIIGALLLLACASLLFPNGNRGGTSIKQKDIEDDVFEMPDEYSAVYADEEFARIIAENPIDRDFVWDDTGSTGRIRQAIEYKELWEAEIAYTFERLRVCLSEQDFETLKQAYESWKEYQ